MSTFAARSNEGRETEMKHNLRLGAVLFPAMLLAACAGGAALQPDRSIFSLDNNYQRHSFVMPIEETFDRTVTVFKDAGYKLDVIDRATGQISGRRGATGDKGSNTDKDLKFYALILPRNGSSELGIKIVQVIKSGTFGTSKAELIVNDPNMYQYAFTRIENVAAQAAASAEASEAAIPAS
jgi:hypothetical protein